MLRGIMLRLEACERFSYRPMRRMIWSRRKRPPARTRREAPGGSKGEWRTTTLGRRGEREQEGDLGEECGTTSPKRVQGRALANEGAESKEPKAVRSAP